MPPIQQIATLCGVQKVKQKITKILKHILKYKEQWGETDAKKLSRAKKNPSFSSTQILCKHFLYFFFFSLISTELKVRCPYLTVLEEVAMLICTRISGKSQRKQDKTKVCGTLKTIIF